jgi:hypothetical protein
MVELVLGQPFIPIRPSAFPQHDSLHNTSGSLVAGRFRMAILDFPAAD